ncbi:MAG: phosphomannomutase/phosphoglucomutase [Chthonomonadaceae bacterium]|nr:phosphomannomutase/phosphoglucomutase [Chthonomonadaceae bacterium]
MTSVNPKVFRAYDIRALVPDLVDESSIYFGKVYDRDSYQAPLVPEQVEIIGKGLANFLKAETVVIGYDSRVSSPDWCAALSRGLTDQGVNVIELGLSTTDIVYFASGYLNLPAVEITASHCTKELNGMKIVRAGAYIVGSGSGMEEFRDLTVSGNFTSASTPGTVTKRNLLEEYMTFLMKFVDIETIKPFKIIADAGNGTGGVIASEIFSRIPQLNTEALYFEPDGRFPNHPANPFEVENIEELIHKIEQEGADLGVAWDGDADRCFFLDETGKPVPGDFITTLVARHFLKLNPGEGIVYDLRASWAVRDWVTKLGGRPISERVGHSYIKRTMRAENAVFGGEVSGHYYFRDNYFADNGFIPLLSVITMLSETGLKMSELVSSLGDYYVSGEINSTVQDSNKVLETLKTKFADGQLDLRDGVSIEYPDWKFNVRPSANDPVIRLNLEAKSQAEMETKRDEILALIRA